MPIELTSMETATPFDQLRLFLVGKEGTGKSRLACTARQNILLIDWDGRKAAVAGAKGVYAFTPIDPGSSTIQPTAFADALDILTKLETSRSLVYLGFNVVDKVAKVKTLVLDSVYSMCRAARRYCLYTTPAIRRTISVGGKMSVHTPNDWTGWVVEMAMVEEFLMRAFAIPGLDVIMTGHESAEKADDSTSEKPKWTGKIGVYPDRCQGLLKYFNEVWRLTRDAQLPKIQLVPDWQFTTKCNLGITNMPEPNISKAIALYLASNPALIAAKIAPQVPALSAGSTTVVAPTK